MNNISLVLSDLFNKTIYKSRVVDMKTIIATMNNLKNEGSINLMIMNGNIGTTITIGIKGKMHTLKYSFILKSNSFFRNKIHGICVIIDSAILIIKTNSGFSPIPRANHEKGRFNKIIVPAAN